MSNIPDQLKYSKEHEWVEILSDTQVRVGITEYAQDSLGDIVYIDMPDVDSDVQKDDSFGTIESVKAVSDVFAPVSGRIVALNDALSDNPAMVNSDPYGDGWLIEMEIKNTADLDELLDAKAYQDYISTL